MKKKIVAIFIALILVVSLSGCGCKERGSSVGLKLEIWGVNDNEDAFGDTFKNYLQLNPKIKEIVYRKFAIDTYKQELIDALASGKGPDIFMINSTWEPSFRNKIVAAPAGVISEKTYRESFVDMVSDAFITDGQIYAVPLTADSLTLYYNKDLFAEAGITNPPKTWKELNSMIPSLTRIDNSGNILKSAIALGTAYNINRSTDILGMIMLQNQVQMTSNNGNTVEFTKSGEGIGAAERSLRYYTNFANRSSLFYSWNPTMYWSLDAFAEGRVAMMLNYSWHMDTIRNKSPKLNFTVAPVPQVEGNPKVSFGNCYGFAVAVNKKPEIIGGDPRKVSIPEERRVEETWKFLRYLTLGYSGVDTTAANSGGSALNLGGGFNASLDPARAYLEKTKKPAARKDLIELQKGIYELGIFAEQNLVARSWRQNNPEAAEAIMGEMIDNVNRGKFSTREAINSAVQRINQASK